jgi:5-oxoprolinase (ATP-hydrolysing)
VADAAGLPIREAAEGFIRIAVENMANAIKQISIARGHDVSRYTLQCFGGAGGQHACLVADALGMERVMIHPWPACFRLMAWGWPRWSSCASERWPGLSWSRCLPSLEAEARAALKAQGVSDVAVQHRAALRYEGSDTALEVPVGPDMAAAFVAAHRARFGFTSDAAVVIETAIVEASSSPGRGGGPPPQAGVEGAVNARSPSSSPCSTASGGWSPSRPGEDLFDRALLSPGERVTGPALIIDPSATTVVEPGWQAEVDGLGNLILTRRAHRARSSTVGTESDPVTLEIMANLFMAIAEEMGVALQNTASSVNIKERLDFSCAIFDRDGALIANAPHIPVHLGSMGDSIRTVIESRGEGRDGRGMKPGDAYVLNAPYRGGTHLPDITVIVPVFMAGDEHPAWYVAARGHHADVGGIAPGSMPPDSRSVDEEGVLIDNELLVDAGAFREAEMRALLGGGRWPARDPDRNIADLKAQIAACTRGANELRRIADDYGREVIDAYMGHVMATAEEAVRRLLPGLPSGSFSYSMDNGAVVRVSSRWMRTRERRPWISPAQARSSPTTSTHLFPSAARRRFMCSAHWWTTRSR